MKIETIELLVGIFTCLCAWGGLSLSFFCALGWLSRLADRDKDRLTLLRGVIGVSPKSLKRSCVNRS